MDIRTKLYKYPERQKKRILVGVEEHKLVDKWGYVRTPEGHLEHRMVYMDNYGPIPPKYLVHHIDHTKTNNDPINLIALPKDFYKQLQSIRRLTGIFFNRAKLQYMLSEYHTKAKDTQFKLEGLAEERKVLRERLLKVKRKEKKLTKNLNNLTSLDILLRKHRKNSEVSKPIKETHRRKGTRGIVSGKLQES